MCCLREMPRERARATYVPSRAPQRALLGAFPPDTTPRPGLDGGAQGHIAFAKKLGSAMVQIPNPAFHAAGQRSSIESPRLLRRFPAKCRGDVLTTLRSD